jgi:hypothetical protein
MPLRDHFHPPLDIRRHWEGLHTAWATWLGEGLNAQLPPGYFAEPTVTFGVEVDIATMEEPGGAAPAGPEWSPPEATLTVPLVLSTTAEVLIYHQEGGPTLVGAIELVSPANKDRPDTRDAFVSKCAAYLHQGIGLVMVDVVTNRRTNLHAALLERIAPGTTPLNTLLYATAYHPVQREGQTQLDVWEHTLTVGQPLPVLPLWLLRGPCLELDLEASYERACRGLRISGNGAVAS